MTLNAFQRSALSGALGFVVYGGWAFWVNVGHSQAAGISAGLLQGSYSFFLTLCMTLVMEYLMFKFKRLPQRGLLTVSIVSIITFLVAYSLHWLNGTPEILLTILPGFVIGLVYSIVYVMGLRALDETTGKVEARS